MPSTRESMEALLNEMKNNPNSRFDVDYYSEKSPNPFEWKALLEGTQGSVYEGGYYMIKIIFTTNYPESRPSVYFLNRIFHPHVYIGGNIWRGTACIKPLGNNITSVLEAVENMFIDHDADIGHGYGEEPEQLLRDKKTGQFEEKAKQWVREYAKLEDIEQYYDL